MVSLRKRAFAVAIPVVAALAVLLPFPGTASAATDVSSNWAGYAVSGKSVHYRRVSGSWTVPAGSDRIAGSVTVTGKRVRISLRDITRGTGTAFTRRMSAPDTTSAEWIVEALSLCTTDGRCSTPRAPTHRS